MAYRSELKMSSSAKKFWLPGAKGEKGLKKNLKYESQSNATLLSRHIDKIIRISIGFRVHQLIQYA